MHNEANDKPGTPVIVWRPDQLTDDIAQLNDLRKTLGYDRLSYEAAYNLVTGKYIHAEIEAMKDELNNKYLKP